MGEEAEWRRKEEAVKAEASETEVAGLQRQQEVVQGQSQFAPCGYWRQRRICPHSSYKRDEHRCAEFVKTCTVAVCGSAFADLREQVQRGADGFARVRCLRCFQKRNTQNGICCMELMSLQPRQVAFCLLSNSVEETQTPSLEFNVVSFFSSPVFFCV